MEEVKWSILLLTFNKIYSSTQDVYTVMSLFPAMKNYTDM